MENVNEKLGDLKSFGSFIEQILILMIRPVFIAQNIGNVLERWKAHLANIYSQLENMDYNTQNRMFENSMYN